MDNKMIVFLTLYAIVILLYMGCTQEQRKGGFEMFADDVAVTSQVDTLRTLNDIPLYPLGDVQITPYPSTPLYFDAGRLDLKTTQRECAIYQTPNVDVCKQYEKWYNLPQASLTQKQNDPNLSPAQRSAASTIIADRTNNKLPNNNVCRVNLGTQGWVEPIATNDGQTTIPIKNIADPAIQSYGDTLNWGHCYKDMTGKSAAEVQRGMIDNNGIIGMPLQSSPFQNDMKPYAEIKFSTHHFDDYKTARPTSQERFASHLTNAYCSSIKAAPPNMSNVFVKFEVDTTGKIKDMYPVTLNTQTLRFDRVQDANSVSLLYATLYRKKLNTSTLSLNLEALKMGVQIYIIYYDMCGRVDTYDTIPAALSMNDIAGISSVSLAVSGSNTDVTYGEYDAVLALLKAKIAARGSTDNDITTFTNPATAADYRPNLMCTEYNVSGSPSVNNSTDLSNLARSANVRKTYQTAIPGFDASGNRINTVGNTSQVMWIWTGFIKAPVTGTYNFFINSDDASDIFVNNINVASYYNYHSAGARGTVNASAYMNANSFYPISIRLFNAGGTGEVNVYWNKGGTVSKFEYIPASAYYYNDNLLKLEASRLLLQGLTSDIAKLQLFLNTVDTKETMEIAATTVKATGKTFLGSRWSAKYLSGIDARSPSDLMVLVSFNALSGAYVEIPGAPIDGMYTVLKGPAQIQGPRAVLPVPDGIDFRGPVRYTCSLSIKVENMFDKIRNIFCLGEDDGDRTPSIYIWDKSLNLHIKAAASNDGNAGLDRTTFELPLRTYATVTLVVDNNRMSVYFNGVISSTVNLANGNKFIWGRTQHKKLTMNMYDPPGWQNGYVEIKNFVWFNEVFDDARVSELVSSMN